MGDNLAKDHKCDQTSDENYTHCNNGFLCLAILENNLRLEHEEKYNNIIKYGPYDRTNSPKLTWCFSVVKCERLLTFNYAVYSDWQTNISSINYL